MSSKSPSILVTAPVPDEIVPSVRRRVTDKKDLKPKQYAEAVDDFSRLSTGAGQDHEELAQFLTSLPQSGSASRDYTPTSSDNPFVVLYRIGQTTAEENGARNGGKPAGRSDPNKSVESFHYPQEFERVSPPTEAESQSQIIFLRGYPSADWLNVIGSRYMVDPEYFCQHLDFTPAEDRSKTFSTPALPSSSWHLMRLPLMTIGLRDELKGQVGQEKINKLRRDDHEALRAFHHRLRTHERELRLGDSILRHLHTFDETHFSMEQRVSICVQERGKVFVMFVWLDSANAFDHRNEGPWSSSIDSSLFHATQSRMTKFIPIIKHKPMMALKSHLMSAQTASLNGNFGRRPPQTASLLCLDYGRSLHTHIMASDAFYALDEVFTLVASAEMQFLNLADSKVDKFTRPTLRESDSLPNLRYVKDLLYRHIQYLDEVKSYMHNAEHRKWPRATGDARKKAVAAAEALHQNFDHLHNRAQKLHTRCTENIAVLMNSIAIAESREAIDQTKRLSKLTFLAFIFVPLSFTTSFFGMNLRELTPPRACHMWAWVAMAVPLTVVTVSLYFVDFTGMPTLRR